MKSTFTMIAVFALSLCLHSSASHGAPITILNDSFELNDAGDILTTIAPNWNAVDGFSTFDPTNPQFIGTTGDNVQGELPGGGQVGNLQPGRVFTQNLGVSATVGATYTLDYFIGARRDGATTGTHRVELLEGANTIFTAVHSPTAFGFAAAPQLSGVATGSGTLTLRFSGLTGQNFIDLPSLNETLPPPPAPEPSSIVLAMLGCVGLVARRRRRVRS